MDTSSKRSSSKVTKVIKDADDSVTSCSRVTFLMSTFVKVFAIFLNKDHIKVEEQSTHLNSFISSEAVFVEGYLKQKTDFDNKNIDSILACANPEYGRL